MHLVNAMGYVSQWKSTCDGSFGGKKKKGKVQKFNHFWILAPLPVEFKLPAILQWDGGVVHLIDQEYSREKPEFLARVPLSRDTGLWRIASGTYRA